MKDYIAKEILISYCIVKILKVPNPNGCQGLSQDLETGCPKLAIVKYLGGQIFKGVHNIPRFQS